MKKVFVSAIILLFSSASIAAILAVYLFIYARAAADMCDRIAQDVIDGDRSGGRSYYSFNETGSGRFRPLSSECLVLTDAVFQAASTSEQFRFVTLQNGISGDSIGDCMTQVDNPSLYRCYEAKQTSSDGGDSSEIDQDTFSSLVRHYFGDYQSATSE